MCLRNCSMPGESPAKSQKPQKGKEALRVERNKAKNHFQINE